MMSGAQEQPSAIGLWPLEDKIFYSSLIGSFLLHLFTIASLFYANVHHLNKPQKTTELIYQGDLSKARSERQNASQRISVKEQKLTPSPKILTKKGTDPNAALKRINKQPVKLSMPEKVPSRISLTGQKRHVSVPVLKSEKMTNPKYLNYHELIRSKIKNRAYRYVDDPRFKAGEVYLTFVLSSDGALRDIKIIGDRTAANDYLQGVGLRSIKESSPFPPFPSDLKYPELTFNVVISFEINN